jgi:hypothetical protein
MDSRKMSIRVIFVHTTILDEYITPLLRSKGVGIIGVTTDGVTLVKSTDLFKQSYALIKSPELLSLNRERELRATHSICNLESIPRVS